MPASRYLRWRAQTLDSNHLFFSESGVCWSHRAVSTQEVPDGDDDGARERPRNIR
jgi:hypothetical protein